MKKHYFIHFCWLLLKSSEAFRVSLNCWINLIERLNKSNYFIFLEEQIVRTLSKYQKMKTLYIIILCRSFMAFDTPLPAGIYMFKVNNRKTRTWCEICSKSRRSGVFIVNFERISHLALLFLFLTLSREMPTGLFFM